MNTFERVLSGELGDEAKQTAERATQEAVAKVADMFAPTKLPGGVMLDFASGGTFTALKGPIRALGDECVVPLSVNDEIRKRAIQGGYTELRFNPETTGWAYHRPDEAVGMDGRRYVRVQAP